MCAPLRSTLMASRSGLVVFECGASSGEAEGIMWSIPLLPHLTVSSRGREKEPASREIGPDFRTRSTAGLSGPVDRRKLSKKLTAAHSGSSVLRIAEDGAVAVHYLPRTFEELPELESVA